MRVACVLRVALALRVAFALLAAIACGPALAAAQSATPHPASRWFAQVGGEASVVSNAGTDTTWTSQSATVLFQEEAAGGWRAFVERQARGSASDVVFGTGGYRRLGDWTIGGSVAATPGASFWYRRAFNVELSRRVAGTLVASGAYQYMDFPAAVVHQAQPAFTWYNARGQVQARVFVTRNSTQHRTSVSLLLLSDVRLTPRVSLVAAVADGDRIFDVASLAYGPASSWLTHGGLRVQLSPRDRIEFGGGYARERPAFTQTTVALWYRRGL